MKRDDIAVVLHCFDLKWARDLNDTLSEIFYCPLKFPKELPYMAGRSMQLTYNARLIEKLRSQKITKIIFVNYLEDFSFEFIKVGFVKEIYGICVASSNLSPGKTQGSKGTDRFMIYQNALIDMANKIFVPTELLKNSFEQKKKINVLGLPIVNTFQEPKTSDKIIFNARLNKEKNPMGIFSLSKENQQRMVVTTPKGSTDYIGKFKRASERREIRAFHFNPSEKEYKSILQSCGFGISFAEEETFGYSLIDCISNGLMCFAPKNAPLTCYNETTIDELMYQNFGDLQEKLEYYRNHSDERKEIVLKAQNKIRCWQKEQWQKSLLSHLN